MPSVPSSIPSKLSNPTSISHPHSHSSLCRHSPSATLDLLILIVVLFSGSFLVSSYFFYIFNSISLLLSLSSFHFPNFSPSFLLSLPYLLGFFTFLFISILLLEFCCGHRTRRCDRPGCKGTKKSMEFDLQLQTEDSIRSVNGSDTLPWKGGSESSPDYELLRIELRKMAPPNGRALLMFRAQCGCAVAKLEGWGPKRSGRKQKKALNG